MIKETVISYTINLLYCDDKGECVFSYTINLLYCDNKGECVLVILSIYYIVMIKESVF